MCVLYIYTSMPRLTPWFRPSAASSLGTASTYYTSYSTGIHQRAYDWAVAVRCSDRHLVSSYEELLWQFQGVFDHPDQGQSSSQSLLTFHQGTFSVWDISENVCIFAAESGWNEPAMITLFNNGLNPPIQMELVCRDEGKDLNSLIALAITLDQHL